MLQALLVWTLFAFGGAYPWTMWPVVVFSAWLAISVRPAVMKPGHRVVDVALVAALVAVALQAVPVPPAVRDWLSPGAGALEAQLVLGSVQPGWRALSLNPAATLEALLVGAACVLVFFSAREVLAAGGVRRIVRTIAAAGLLVSLVAVAQRTVSPRLIYGFWEPFDAGAHPLGPFVNRNHLVAWMLMAAPLVAGYTLARSFVRTRDHAWSGVWLAGSVLVMIALIFVSLSRSGIVALAAVAAIGGVIVHRRMGPRQRWGLSFALVVALLMIASYTNVPALLARVDTTLDVAHGGVDRRAIWHDTARIIRDFPLTGVGVGGYQKGMLVYQSAIRSEVFFNHAHNQYLQLAAEGGVLLAVPMAVALAAFLAAARRCLRDQSGLGWIRVGALAGMAGVAVQSVWDIGLALPANAMLFAVLAAIVTYQRPGADAALSQRGMPRQTR